MAEMKVLPLDYATKDYDGFLQMFKDTIPVLTPEWTDMSDTDQGMVILQLLAYALHIQSYNIDKGIAENLIQLAKTKKSVLLLSKFLGYEIKTQQASTSTVTFTKKSASLNKQVVIPARTKITTDPALGEVVIFETDDSLIIPTGVTSGTINVTQGESTLREEIGVGTGDANQKFLIKTLEVLHGSIFLQTIESGAIFSWTQVENFIDSLPQDRHYTAELNEDGETIISFGDGVTGMRPVYNSIIETSYRYGGGIKGNLSAGKLNTLVVQNDDIESLTNEIEATGGSDYEDLEKVRTQAPKNYRTGGSAVTPQDFQDFAETFSGIGRAVCIETFNANNDVNLYLAPEDGVVITQTLKDQVKDTIEDVMVMNQNLNVYEVSYYTYNLTLTVYLYDNFSQAEVKYQVESILKDYLHPNKFTFGETIYLGQIASQVFPVRGVKNAVITAPSTDITPSATQLPKLGTLTVNIQGGIA